MTDPLTQISLPGVELPYPNPMAHGRITTQVNRRIRLAIEDAVGAFLWPLETLMQQEFSVPETLSRTDFVGDAVASKPYLVFAHPGISAEIRYDVAERLYLRVFDPERTSSLVCWLQRQLERGVDR